VRLQIEGGPRVLGLELNKQGDRLLVTTADCHLRIYLLHRPGQRQPLRHEQRLARAAESSRGAGGIASAASTAQQQRQAGQAEQQPQPGSHCSGRSYTLDEACRAAAAPCPATQKRRCSVFYDNSAAWLTWQLDLITEATRRKPWKCAAFSPGACTVLPCCCLPAALRRL
jgi:hypothetical protein